MRPQELRCAICGHTKFVCIDSVSFGNWLAIKKNRPVRKDFVFRLKRCAFCGHIVSSGDYSAKNIPLLYPQSGLAISAIKTRPYIAQSVIDYVYPYLKTSDTIHIADLGGADGTFLKTLISYLHARKRAARIIADNYDLRVQRKKGVINFYRCNFNVSTDVRKTIRSFDFGFCIHVLEHLTDPRVFLATLSSNLQKNFRLYIEVPANELLSERFGLNAELIHPQHINMFTKPHLEFMVAAAGLTVIKSRYEANGDIPRIQIVAEKRSDDPGKTIKRFIRYKHSLFEGVAILLMRACRARKKIAVWGVGQNLFDIIKINPAIVRSIRSGDLVLVDLNLSGKIVCGAPVIHPKDIATSGFKIVVLPHEEQTVKSIRSSAGQFGITQERMVYPYKKRNTRFPA